MSVARTEQTLSRGGLALHYIDEGMGTPVVLLQALMASADANWVQTGVLDRLVATGGLRAIAPDFRGHGGSGRAAQSDAYSLDLLVEDTVWLIQQLGVGPCHLVGYSLGALVAARIAADGPVPLLRVVLCGVGAETVATLPRDPTINAMVEAMRAADAGTIANPALKAARLQIEAWHTDPEAVAAMYRSLQDKSGADLSAIQLPVLVINGTADTPPAEIADEISGASTATVAGDHVTALYDPAFGERIVRFLLEEDPRD